MAGTVISGCNQSLETHDNAAMYNCWWTNKGANERSFVFVHQHGDKYVT